MDATGMKEGAVFGFAISLHSKLDIGRNKMRRPPARKKKVIGNKVVWFDEIQNTDGPLEGDQVTSCCFQLVVFLAAAWFIVAAASQKDLFQAIGLYALGNFVVDATMTKGTNMAWVIGFVCPFITIVIFVNVLALIYNSIIEHRDKNPKIDIVHEESIDEYRKHND
ncbi:hypothetical protein [Microcoleus sp. B7-D4]|uniref:hypothetical protein n=1 Tax=Microcoleus sp. B7-D4 TaxID=2818696 RepID=UPI002FD0CCD4